MTVPAKKNENLPSNPEDELDFYDFYSEAGRALTGSNIIGHLLRFTKYGEYKAGQDAVDIPIGTELIVHMGEMQWGWQKWENNIPVEKAMGKPAKGFKPARRDELGDLDEALWEVDNEGKSRDPWQLTQQLVMKGVDDDELYTFSTSSWGGRKAVGKLMEAYGDGARMRPGQIPVVKLGWGTQTHRDKTIGDYRVPRFTVTRWVDRKPFDLALAGAAEVTDDQQEQLPLAEETKPAHDPVQAAIAKKKTRF